jgi:hypothetical protein
MKDDHLAALVGPLQDLEQWFTSCKIPHAIVGGVAATLQGEPRATQDIDAVVLIAETEWAAFLKSGKKFGFLPRRENSLEFAKRSRVLLFEHRTGIGIDISLGALPFEREMIDRSIRVKLQGVVLRLATPEDLIVMKSLAMRPKDITDIESLLDANKTVDLKRVRYWVSAFAHGLDAPEIAEQIEALLARRSKRPTRKRKRGK